MTDHYNVLGVLRNATVAGIKSAFQKLALIWHPDKALDEPEAHTKFIAIREAQEVLCDPERRRECDDNLQTYASSSVFTPSTSDTETEEEEEEEEEYIKKEKEESSKGKEKRSKRKGDERRGRRQAKRGRMFSESS